MAPEVTFVEPALNVGAFNPRLEPVVVVVVFVVTPLLNVGTWADTAVAFCADEEPLFVNDGAFRVPDGTAYDVVSVGAAYCTGATSELLLEVTYVCVVTIFESRTIFPISMDDISFLLSWMMLRCSS